jgi:uncharacterized Ntn-hydrolase superfamily protein
MTYSIVARDRDTGELGVGVQSRAFNTGAVVPWARAGVGAVATQAFGERRYGYRGLELMSTGIPPADALAQLRDADNRAEYRQVAMIDAAGTTAQHTGGACIEAAGHTSGAGWAAQANMVDSQRVWESMGEAFESASGTLARRLLAALDAAQAAGGDWRGMQAGGILVVPAEGEPWERVVDLRVDDSDAPLTELRRLLDAAEAYRAISAGEQNREHIARDGRLRELDVRWAAVFDTLAAGDVETARMLLAPLLAEEPRWASYVRTLGELGRAPGAEALLD